MAFGIQYLNMKLIPSFFYKQWDYVYTSMACVKLCCERMNIFGESDRQREEGNVSALIFQALILCYILDCILRLQKP